MSIPSTNLSLTTLNDYYGWKSTDTNYIPGCASITSTGSQWFSLSDYNYLLANAQLTSEISMLTFAGKSYTSKKSYSQSLINVTNNNGNGHNIGFASLDLTKPFIFDMTVDLTPIAPSYSTDIFVMYQSTGGGEESFYLVVDAPDDDNRHLQLFAFHWYTYIPSIEITIPLSSQTNNFSRISIVYTGPDNTGAATLYFIIMV